MWLIKSEAEKPGTCAAALSGEKSSDFQYDQWVRVEPILEFSKRENKV
jgi:hypothetical protein